MIYAIYLIPLIYLIILHYTENLKLLNFKKKSIKIHYLALSILLPLLLFLLTFPGRIEKVAFTFGNVQIRWYALWILLGIIYALHFAIKEAKKQGLSTDILITGVMIILPLSLIGARIWFYLFNMDHFENFIDIFNIRDGWSGIAIQGGIMTALLGMIIYSLVRKISILKVFDIVAPTFLIGQIFGRVGNFCNHELYGSMVNNLDLFNHLFPRFIRDNMYITGSDLLPGLKEGYYHPMFLYEMMLNSIGLISIVLLRKYFKYLRSGDMVGYYLIFYGVSRTITESLRLEGEVLMFGNIRVSLLLAILFIISGAAYLSLKLINKKIPLYSDIIRKVKDNKIDTILFDLDGTLIDSKELVSISFIEIFKKYFPDHTLTEEDLDNFFGPTLEETFSKFEPNETKRKTIIDDYRKFYHEHHDTYVKLFKGVKDILKTLKKENYKLGIITSKKDDYAIKALEKTNIKEYFDIVIGSDSVSKPKPNPEGILKAKEELKAKNILFVGDSIQDVKAAKAAKVKVVAINHDYNQKREADLLLTNPDYYIYKIYNLNQIL